MEIQGHEVQVGVEKKKGIAPESGPVVVAKRFIQLKPDESKILDWALNRKGLDLNQVMQFPFDEVSEEERNSIYSLLGDFLFHTDSPTKEKIAKEFAQSMAKLYN
jgi:hypothetical protein